MHLDRNWRSGDGGFWHTIFAMTPIQASSLPSPRTIEVVRSGDQFLLRGTESWAQPGSVDMLLHDIFHHGPSDDGSMICELMSYGAQVWISHHTDELRLGVSYEELSAVIEDLGEAHSADELARIFLVETPLAGSIGTIGANVESRFLERFRNVALQAFQESSFSGALAKIPDDVMGSICDCDNINHCANWMALGFVYAQKRYPDPEATLELINKLRKGIRLWSKQSPGHLRFDLDEGASQVTSKDLDFQQIWDELSPRPAVRSKPRMR